jgi:hypothetical protein
MTPITPATRPVAHLSSYEGGRLPPAIGKGHGDHGGADGPQQSKRYRPVEQREGMERAPAEHDTEHDQSHNRTGL